MNPTFDPIKDLHPKQQLAFRSSATETLFGGAAGPGKSHFLRYLAVFCAFAVPGIQIYLFRRTSPDLEKNHIQGPTGFPAVLANYIAAGIVKYNQQKGMFTFPGGGRIFLCHCQYEKDLANYQGAEIHLLLIDELTHFTETMYRYLRGRVRLGGWRPRNGKYKKIFPKIMCGSNPGGIGHNWVKGTFVTYQPWYEIKRTPKKDGGMLRQYIPAKLEDNPTMNLNDPDYANRLSGLGSAALVKAMLDGDWDIVAGGAFDDVWELAKHTLQPFDVPKNWRIDRSFDWGSSHPFSVGWWAKANGEEVKLKDGTRRSFYPGTLIRIAEWYGWDGTADHGCKMLAKDIAKGIVKRENDGLLKNLNVKPGPADNSIFDVENGVCIAKDMETEKVRWTRSNKNPGSRINGLELVRGLLSAATKHPQESPGMYVFNNCNDGFIRTIPVLPRSPINSDDIDTKSEDHAWDEVRYRALDTARITTTQEI